MKRTTTLLAGMAVILSLTGALADDDDDQTFEQKIIRNLMGGGARPDIDYRERSPLVIPPSGTQGPQGAQLPAPDNRARTREMAAWPKDPDKKKKPKDRGIMGAFEANRESERPLTPGEMRRGARSGSSQVQAPPRREHESGGRPMMPSEVGGGREEKTIFGMFGAQFGGPKETAKFTGEPTRQSLTQPPTGYQTPASSQPYQAPAGTGLLSRIPTFFDRGTEGPNGTVSR